ncbi:hypothetical protein Egran_03912 [Elaphomyces granulatus]|uniref:non-specific serine/threonine protein kinase n=1 Tax=Elaphomyces granulatus TaxID=519963 RepID=A0A232LVW1_9EURO|nr:hypothetical protein Egran_03912 [Elaphomyces granulatus]
MSIALAEADKYEVLEKIGSGSFGIIRKVKRKSDGFILCRKEISYIKMSQKEREQLTAEFNILSSLRHPNIVAYYHREHLKASQELYLYMEYCGGGDLGMVIKNLKTTNKFAEEEFVWHILAQLVTALYRCHYGVDPPEVGSNILAPVSVKPSGLKGKQAQVMILHRDLKPDNIFLGSDNTVKLGDFGLSKLMHSHEFASTYVGTPFYMSPEICAAERYTLQSDIWGVGCVMYELCQKQPPFNAKTPIQLVQKIREGKFPPLPDIYSPELKNVIASCLQVNPDRRPDTAALFNLPVIRLMRRERDIINLSNTLRRREETAAQKVKEMEEKLAAKLEQERVQMRSDIDNTVRREWEVKARLEIDRQVQMEIEKLRKRFEIEVQARVAAEVEKQRKSLSPPGPEVASWSSQHNTSASSVSGSEDTDFPSTTDLSELSLDSPPPSDKPLKSETRTPLSRSRTTIDSPIDIQMGEPSPIAIASLALSPRRPVDPAPSARNIFAPHRFRCDTLVYSDDEDDIPDLPSPTRPKVRPDPLKAPIRPLLRHNTAAAMLQISSKQPSLFPIGSKLPPPPGTLNTVASHPDLRQGFGEVRPKSPNRHLTKMPSSANLAADAGSPPRNKAAAKQLTAKTSGSDEDIFKTVMQRNMGGRTLVELAQARAGGRSLDELKQASGESRVPLGSADREAVATWDPEKDEMPSPFLARGNKIIRNLR